MEKSRDGKHKYLIKIETPKGTIKKIRFGAKGYSDYTKHGDVERKKRYIARHKKNEDFDNMYKAAFYARWVLWNKKTIKASLADIKKKYNLIIFNNAEKWHYYFFYSGYSFGYQLFLREYNITPYIRSNINNWD